MCYIEPDDIPIKKERISFENDHPRLEQEQITYSYKIDLENNGLNTIYLAPIYMGSQSTPMKCVWDTGSGVGS